MQNLLASHLYNPPPPPTHIIHRHTKAVPSVSCIAETNHNITRLRPHAPEFVPTVRQGDAAISSGLPHISPGITDFTKYIMKKDILLSRLTQLNDKPENYFMWKTSFKSIVKELGVTFTEELDLLCRWLGPESSRQATSLRTANCHDESVEVKMIWERLDKKHHFVEFMEKIFENKHAERAPPLEEGEGHWYLPIFGVYHPKKPTKIRVVFDSSAK